jgi:hypothetical protein
MENNESITVDGQVWTAERIKSLCETIWPGKPKWKPTPEEPQIDFYEAVVDSLRWPEEEKEEKGY